MSNFRLIDRDTGFLMPPSVDEWLPQRHLARFVVEVVAGLDLRAMAGSYRGSGEASYHPQLLLGLIIYGYATGVFSSRKLERATFDSVAFRFIMANRHPDHDVIAAFRRRFLPEIEGLFVQVLGVAREMGVLKLGTVVLDGTKIHANASRHSALSYEHAGKIEAQLKAEVADLMAKAAAADQTDVPDGMQVPEELARRETRLAAIARAKATIEARAKERHAREQAEHDAKMAQRAAKTAATGKKPRGRVPQPPAEGPLPTAQVNLTDEPSRIMPVAGGGFGQCYNAQAVVAVGSLLVIAADVTQAPNEAAAGADAGPDRRPAKGPGLGWRVAGGQRVSQRGQRESLRCGGDRAADRDGARGASPPARRAFCRAATAAAGPHAACGDEPSPANARGRAALCLTQAHARAGVRHHQVRAWLPSVPAAWP